MMELILRPILAGSVLVALVLAVFYSFNPRFLRWRAARLLARALAVESGSYAFRGEFADRLREFGLGTKERVIRRSPMFEELDKR
jgi:hypothetical protein